MADTKISGLTSGSAVADADVFPAVETTGVGPVKKTAAQLKTYAQTGVAKTANNLSDLASASSARTNLGLGSAATLTAGTSAYNLVQLDATGKLPALDGTVLTGIPQYTDKLSAFATTSSTELATVINGKTGTGNLVFASSPTLSSPTLGNATATTVNKLTFTQPVSGATLTLADGSTLATSGAYGVTLTSTGTTTLTLPTSGTLATLNNTLGAFAATSSAQLASVINDETGSGALVFATSPALVTPTLGVASATSINKVAFTAPATSATLTLANGSTLATSGAYSITLTGTGSTNVTLPTSGTLATTANKLSDFSATSSAELAGIIPDETGSGSLVFANSPTLVTPNLGTPSAANLSNATGLPIGSGVSGLGSGVATFLSTPSSANLRAALTDETGTGSAVFATSPTISSPTVTGAVAVNGVTSGSVSLKAPAVAGSTTFQLPSSNGTSGYLLATDGLGNTSWVASGGAVGSAAGLNTQVQFNDSGNMAGNAGLTFNKTTAALTIGVQSTSQGSLVLTNTVASAFPTTIISSNSATAAWTLTLPTSAGTSNFVLTTNGSGVSSWSQVSLTAGVTGTLPVANGGTGVTSVTSGRIPFGSGTSAFGSNANLFWDNSNNQLDLGAGTAALPALSTISDNNTGFFFPAADTIAASTGGAEAIRITSTGNIGIGTASPSDKLQIAGSARSTSFYVSNTRRVLDSYEDTSSDIIFAAEDYNGSYPFKVDTTNSTVVGTGNVTSGTNRSTELLYFPLCSNAPTGTPFQNSGRVPILFCTADSKIYVHNGTSWLSSAALT